jgi:phospholipid N-methyltransferase
LSSHTTGARTGAGSEPERIFQLAAGFMASKFLFAAADADIFALLADGPATAREIHERSGLPERTVRIVADAMVALGLLDRTDDHYENGPEAAEFLTGRGRADLRPFLRFWDRLSYPQWAELARSVRSGEAAAAADMTGDEQRLFSEGIEAVTSGSARALAAAYDFRTHTDLLDLGGGTGSFARAVLDRYPHMEATLYDLPAVIELATPRWEGRPDAQRLRLEAGDFLRDPLPADHDVALLSHVVHAFSPEENRRLLTRVRERIAHRGRLLLVDFWMDRTHTSPVFGALMSGEFLVRTGEGQSYSVDEGRRWLADTGWSWVDHLALDGPTSVLIAENPA